jgi:hypothetical protein
VLDALVEQLLEREMLEGETLTAALAGVARAEHEGRPERRLTARARARRPARPK